MWSCGCSFTTFILVHSVPSTQCPVTTFSVTKSLVSLTNQVPRYLGTWVPGYLGTWVPGYLGTWVPGYLGKHVRFCSRKHVHFFAITRILFVYVLSQIEKKSIRVIAIYPKMKKDEKYKRDIRL